MHDLIIRNVRIVDGSGSPWFIGDVAVSAGKIAAVGVGIPVPAKETIDGTGLTITPGFIDIHSHSDFTLPLDGAAESRLLQGVTTEIAGNCGLSPAPVHPERLDMLQKYAGFLTQGLAWDWRTFGEFLTAVERARPGLNVASLVGHGTLRVAAMGFADRLPTASELAHMQQLLYESMQQGAFGVSTGLIYPPGCYSNTDELAQVVSVVSPFGGYYETHMRDEGDNILDSIEESAEVGRRAKVPVQIAHHKVVGRYNWGNSKLSQARLAELRNEGLDIACDQYPYIAASTTITTMFPNWAHEGGVDGLLARLVNPEVRPRLRSEVLGNMERTARRFEDILIAGVSSESNKRYEGLTVAQAASLVNQDACDFAFDLVIAERAGVAVVTFGMYEADVAHIMAHPLTMVGSDGCAMPIDGPGKPHPRTFSTFVRVLAKYALTDGLFSFEEGVRKMTSLPASRARLWNRGLIRPGFAADLVLLDTQTLEDRATYAAPRQAPAGICRVWVNGQLAAKDGKVTTTRAGQVLRLND